MKLVNFGSSLGEKDDHREILSKSLGRAYLATISKVETFFSASPFGDSD